MCVVRRPGTPSWTDHSPPTPPCSRPTGPGGGVEPLIFRRPAVHSEPASQAHRQNGRGARLIHKHLPSVHQSEGSRDRNGGTYRQARAQNYGLAGAGGVLAAAAAHCCPWTAAPRSGVGHRHLLLLPIALTAARRPSARWR